MAYFPFFMELSDLEGLVVGGGTVALRKIEKLLDYGARLTVCAPSFLPELKRNTELILLQKPFHPELLRGKRFVIAATDQKQTNRDIGMLCRARNIPVNVVDDRAASSFLFPALVRRGELSIGISTGGSSPSAAIYWKNQIASLLPEDTADLLAYLDGLREAVKEEIPEEKERAAVFSRMFRTCMENGWPLGESELSSLLDSAKECAL